MRLAAISVLGVLVLLAGCGGDDDSAQPPSDEPTAAETQADAPAESGGGGRDGARGDSGGGGEGDGDSGTEIVAGDSEFGEMLYDSNDQAIYIFENDSEDETVCYEECAEAWPPVTTEGEPQAGDGIDQSLLGTIERDDGSVQVTYAGQPLYFYAHEAPGEVRCHNVDLNGGFWWVVGPDGERLA